MVEAEALISNPASQEPGEVARQRLKVWDVQHQIKSLWWCLADRVTVSMRFLSSSSSKRVIFSRRLFLSCCCCCFSASSTLWGLLTSETWVVLIGGGWEEGGEGTPVKKRNQPCPLKWSQPRTSSAAGIQLAKLQILQRNAIHMRCHHLISSSCPLGRGETPTFPTPCISALGVWDSSLPQPLFGWDGFCCCWFLLIRELPLWMDELCSFQPCFTHSLSETFAVVNTQESSHWH